MGTEGDVTVFRMRSDKLSQTRTLTVGDQPHMFSKSDMLFSTEMMRNACHRFLYDGSAKSLKLNSRDSHMRA